MQLLWLTAHCSALSAWLNRSEGAAPSAADDHDFKPILRGAEMWVG